MVFWVHAGTAARFEEGYGKIAQLTKPPGWDQKGFDTLVLVKDWLSDAANGNWLMIVDNADDTDVFFNDDRNESEQVHVSLAGFIPHPSKGRILFTSRHHQLACQLTERVQDVFEVKTMDPDKAVQLFRNKALSKVQACEEEVKELTQLLEYFPLAIAQAAGYISQGAPRETVAKYMDKLTKLDSARKLLEKPGGDWRAEGTSSITSTWQISFEKIEKRKPSASRLLSLMSLFDRQGIPVSLLKLNYKNWSTVSPLPTDGAFQGFGDDVMSDLEQDFDEDIMMLHGYSLLTFNACVDELEMHEMHRLVQYATKMWLERENTLNVGHPNSLAF